MGQKIIIERGLTEWFYWANNAVRVERIKEKPTLGKYELQEFVNEIVVLFANLIQGAS